MSLYSTPLKTTSGVRRNTEDNNIPLSRKNFNSVANPFVASKTGPTNTNITTNNKITKPSAAGTHNGTAASRLTSTKFFNPQAYSMMRAPFGNMFGMVASGRSENIEIKNMAEQSPLELASQYVESLQELDNSTPPLDMNSYYSNGVEYNYSKEIGGLGPLTPFERVKVLNIPDELLQKFKESSLKKSTTTQCGIFPEIDRCWFTIDNKLVLWSVKQPNVFQTLDDDFEHDIVKVALVKPQTNTFIHTIEHLLIVATHRDMHVLAISYDENSEDLKVFNTGLSVPLNGLFVNEIVSNSKTGQIFFTAKNDFNVWEFQYSNNDDWFNSKCSKICLTQSFLSHLVPTGFVSKISSFFGTDHNLEHITKLVIDESRGILYTLSSKNVIKGYGLNKNRKGIDYTIVINSHDISTKLKMNNNWRSPLFSNEYFKIVSIVPVSRKENNSLCLVAITVAGCRIYFTGNQGYNSSSLYSNTINNGNVRFTSLTIESVKFPPVTSEVVAEKMNKEISERGKLMMSNNVYNSFDLWNYKLQRNSSTLLSTSTNATIISPGIFFAPVVKKDSKKNENVSHKLYCSVPDYGILKNYSRYTENATFLDTTGDIKCVTPVTQLFNATKTPYGYANEFATQYTREPLQIAVLTSTSLEIYKYRTPDEVFESFLNSGSVEPFVMNNGQAEACSTALFFACKLNKSEQSRVSALNFFLLGIPNVIDLRPTYNTRMTATSFPSAISNGSTLAASSIGNSSATGNLSGGGSTSTIHETLHNELSLDNVLLSPRFYGIALLVSRLCRDIWNKPIFELMGNIKIVDGKILELSTDSTDDSNLNSGNTTVDAKNDGKQLLSKISVSKDELEYYISSIIVLEEFLNKYHDQIICTKATSSTTVGGSSVGSGSLLTKQEEIAYQAENIGINSLIMLIKSIKEALSFLNVLYEESEINGFEGQYLAFKDIIKYLKIDVQLKLSELKFKDFFTGSNSLEVKTLIREVSSSIINRNLLRGRSIDYITNALQERCGSFCSSNDVLGYRAVEHMKKAKEVGLRDFEVLNYHLKNATIYFTKICDDISLDKIKEACWIMLDLNYYPKAIEFLLKMCQSVDKGNLALQYVNDGKLKHDERKKYYDHRMVIYDLIFQILIRLDNEKVITRNGGNSASVIPKTPLKGSQYKEVQAETFGTIPSLEVLEKLRKETYHIVFQNDDKLFHYSLYDWLFEQHQQDKLMEIDTPFILPYLKEHSLDSLEACNMLWIYQSKRSRFYESALILLSLATSNFDIELSKRIEYLSRANGFSKSMCSPNERSKMIKLSSDIKEIFEVAEIQDEILKMVENDSRLMGEDDPKVAHSGKTTVTTQSTMISQLNNKILSVSDLFNDYAEPLEYYEICLLIFQISDFRVHEEIIKKWKQLFVSIQQTQQNDSNPNDLKYLLSNLMVSLGKKLYTNDFVFPVGELIQLIVEFFYNGNTNPNNDNQQISYKTGEIIDMFINCGVPYDKLYYILKNLIETNNFVITIYKKEMIYLIQNWYKEDRNLRDIIKYEQIRSLPEVYELSKDPINEYTEKTGDRI